MTRDELLSAYMAGNRLFIGADLSGVDLSGVDLSGADLSGVDLSVADLSGADLYGADLHGANLSGANLSGAKLSRAYLYGAIMPTGTWWLQGGTRSDGYAFALAKLDADGPALIRAGCRAFTPAEAVTHWTATRGGTPLGDESIMLVKQLVELAALRGLGE